jgi:hydrogenase maturation protease
MGTMERRARPLILGIGNVLMSDDGVGVYAVQELRRRPQAGALITEVGIAMLDAVSLLARADKVLVIDALRAGGAPGSIYLAEAVDLRHERPRLGLHELDLMGALELLPPGRRRPEISMLGVEPERLEPGLGLSPRVAAALPSVVQIASETVARWCPRDAVVGRDLETSSTRWPPG